MGFKDFEVILDRADSYFDDSTIDWVQGRLYISELHLERGNQLIEIIDIHSRNGSNRFPNALFFEFDAPRTPVAITHFPKPSNRAVVDRSVLSWDAAGSETTYSTKHANSYIFYSDVNKFQK